MMENPRKRLLESVLAIIIILIFAARFFVPLHYAGVMPRQPEPQSGRVYRVAVGSGIVVFLNKREINLMDLLNYELSPVAVALLFVLVFLNLRRQQ
jgi:hypothetical protein